MMDSGPAGLNREAEKRGAHPYIRPKDASTLILLDHRSGKEPLVLMGRRHEKHRFMPGLFVFPGGRVDPGDGSMPVASDLGSSEKKALLSGMKGRPTERRCRALALAAIRETWEETGLMLGSENQPSAIPERAANWTPFAERNILPDLSELRFVARAITPPGRPRRYDTRFFVADADTVSYRDDSLIGPDSELQELCWLSLTDAKSLDLPRITLAVLHELEKQISDGLVSGARLPVPYFFADRTGFRRELITI